MYAKIGETQMYVHRMFLGSVSNYCTCHAQCPIIIIKGKETAWLAKLGMNLGTMLWEVPENFIVFSFGLDCLGPICQLFLVLTMFSSMYLVLPKSMLLMILYFNISLTVEAFCIWAHGCVLEVFYAALRFNKCLGEPPLLAILFFKPSS